MYQRQLLQPSFGSFVKNGAFPMSLCGNVKEALIVSCAASPTAVTAVLSSISVGAGGMESFTFSIAVTGSGIAQIQMNCPVRDVPRPNSQLTQLFGISLR